mgnify:CR=1 FL=1|tara:strand:- start:4806 stop:5366 length:561 start_codon:yes stop_codon:yes gene_type:complete
MAFWGGQGGALVDPKRSFRWLITFGASGGFIQSWYAKTAGKPNYEVGKTEHQFLNHTFYYPGRVTWGELNVTLVDPAGENDSSLALVDSLQKAGYYLPINQQNASQTITKAGAVSAAGNQVFLEQLGRNEADVVERWTLVNPWIKNVNFGSLDYSNEEMVQIELTLVYDYATIEAGVPKRTSPTTI